MRFRVSILLLLWLATGCRDAAPEAGRHFIAHRGATMRCTLAGENSREAIRFAARAGFDCIETDVRHTADSVLVAVHDATLNRTFTDDEGRPLAADVAVCDVDYARLRDSFRLRAALPEYRTRVLTLEEFCTECRACGLRLFIEPKKVTPDWVYPRMIEIADRILGRGNYVVTSNNDANDHIRFEMGISDIPLMGILYQTTYEHIASLGRTVVAVSATRFGADEYAGWVARARADGFETESHADDFERFDRVNRAGVDYVSTDLLAPDWRGQGTTRCFSEGCDAQRIADECRAVGQVAFGGIYLDAEWCGSATVTLARQTFVLPEAAEPRRACHQLMLFDEVPVCTICDPSDDFRLVRMALRVVAF
ncbi:MAG: hypothetical protein K2K30_08455 [Alistipes sp.]|nr:hypothetical protein [Alistipes sp.]